MKMSQPTQRWIPASVLGGLFISVGTSTLLFITSSQPTPPVTALGGMAAAAGIAMMVLSGGDLVTANGSLVTPLFFGPLPWWTFPLDLLKKYVGNCVGAFLWAFITIGTGIYGYDANASVGEFGALTSLGKHLCATTLTKADGLNWWELLFRGAIIGVMVSVGLFMAIGMRTPLGRVMPVFLCVTSAVIIGVEHWLGNVFLFTIATIIKCPVSNHGMYWRNVVLSTIGTLVAGFTFGSVVYSMNASLLPPAPPVADPSPDKQSSADSINSNAQPIKLATV